MSYGEQKEKSLSDMLAPILASIRRYWKFTIGPVIGVLAIGLFLSFHLPSYYAADTLIFIQPQRISSKMVENPEKDEMKERLEALVQEILSRPRLRAVMDRFNLYPDIRGKDGGELAIRKFRSAIQIEPAQSPTGGTQLLQTFQLSFSHEDAKTVYEVTKALANLFIEESVVSRQSETQGTEEFFEAQLAEARKQLEETESKVRDFVTANFGKLPEHLEQATARLSNLQAQLDANTQLMASNMMRRDKLQEEMAEARRIGTMTVPGSQNGAAYEPNASVEQLESALVVLTSKYSDQHPDVINTRKRIAALRQQLGKAGPSGTRVVRSSDGSMATLNVKRMMNEVDVQLSSLRQENENLKKNLDQLQKDIEEMPLREQELLKIRRDYALMQGKYEKLNAEREEAKLQSSLLRSQKGAQLRIVEPAEMPSIPAGPPRLIMAFGSIAFSSALFFALPIAFLFLNGSFRSKDEVESELGLKVLGIVPPMITPDALAAQRRLSFASMAVSAVSVAFVSVVVLIFV